MSLPTAEPGDLAVRVARAARRPGAARTMLLDLDGTLAPIAALPHQTMVPPEVLECMDRLRSDGWTMAVVSGRPVASARRLVPVAGVHVFGSHGLEGPWPRGRRPRVSGRTAGRIARLGREAAALVGRVPGAWLERKPAGFAIHDRAATGAQRVILRRALQAWLEGADLDGIEILPGKRVVEARAAGIHKGRVLEALGVDGRRRLDASLLAIGDDRSDEDLFRALGGRGLTVHVGRRGTVTSARLRLASPRRVASFLRHLARACDGATG